MQPTPATDTRSEQHTEQPKRIVSRLCNLERAMQDLLESDALEFCTPGHRFGYAFALCINPDEASKETYYDTD